MKLQDLEYIKEVIDSLVVSEDDYAYGPLYALEVDKQQLASTMLNRMIRELKLGISNDQKPMTDAEIAKLLNVSEEWFLKSDLTKLKNLVRLVEQHHGIGE